MFVNSGANVNISTKNEESPLHKAAERGSVPLIDVLQSSTSFKLNLDARNKNNETPLIIAAEHQYLEAVKRLVELGADLNTKRNDGWNPIYTASYNGKFSLTKNTNKFASKKFRTNSH